MRASLDDIGIKHKTDKASNRHGFLAHYERLLAPIREQSFDMLEIGVLNGASIRMWHEYLPAARIVGVDLKPIHIEDHLPRYTFVKGSQADPRILRQLVESYKFRLIIDDGSHLWGHQIFTFQTLFPWLEEGGIYICEDIQTSFGSFVERYSGGAKESAAAYFIRIAQALAAGNAEPVKQSEDPLLYFVVSKIRSITIIRHCVIITT